MPESKPRLTIEIFNAGWISSAASIWRQGDHPDHRIRFPVSAFLIEAGNNRVLVDTGLNPDAIDDPEAFYGRAEAGLFALELDSDITTQLDLSSLTHVVITHMHFDHVGAATLLPPSVPIFVQRREWEGAHDDAAIQRNYFYPRDYQSLGDRNLVLVQGDFDLLGDGSVRLLLTPGHTPGHQSIMIGEELVLGGDAAHFHSTLEDKCLPVFADDFSAQARSIDRLCQLRDSGLVIIPSHDPEFFERVRSRHEIR